MRDIQMQLYPSWHFGLHTHLLLWECRFFYLHTPPITDASWDALSFIFCSLQPVHLHAGEKALGKQACTHLRGGSLFVTPCVHSPFSGWTLLRASNIKGQGALQSKNTWPVSLLGGPKEAEYLRVHQKYSLISFKFFFNYWSFSILAHNKEVVDRPVSTFMGITYLAWNN